MTQEKEKGEKEGNKIKGSNWKVEGRKEEIYHLERMCKIIEAQQNHQITKPDGTVH